MLSGAERTFGSAPRADAIAPSILQLNQGEATFPVHGRQSQSAGDETPDQTAIDLGSGNRSVVRDGAYDSRYRLVLPKELVGHV